MIPWWRSGRVNTWHDVTLDSRETLRLQGLGDFTERRWGYGGDRATVRPAASPSYGWINSWKSPAGESRKGNVSASKETRSILWTRAAGAVKRQKVPQKWTAKWKWTVCMSVFLQKRRGIWRRMVKGECCGRCLTLCCRRRAKSVPR